MSLAVGTIEENVKFIYIYMDKWVTFINVGNTERKKMIHSADTVAGSKLGPLLRRSDISLLFRKKNPHKRNA